MAAAIKPLARAPRSLTIALTVYDPRVATAKGGVVLFPDIVMPPPSSPQGSTGDERQ